MLYDTETNPLASIQLSIHSRQQVKLYLQCQYTNLQDFSHTHTELISDTGTEAADNRQGTQFTQSNTLTSVLCYCMLLFKL